MSEMQATINEPRTRPISVVEYHRMGEAGILGPDERLQLLNGRIIQMPPMNPGHAFSVTELAERLRSSFDDNVVIRTQMPVTLDDFSEPQPDVIVATGPRERYAHAHPRSADALVVVEVAESSLRIDRTEKLAAYARSGVVEYWVVNLVDHTIEVHTDPIADRYDTNATFRRGENIALRNAPTRSISVAAVLPPGRT